MKYLKTFEKKTNYSITLCFNDIYEILSKYYGDAFLRTPDTGSDDCEYRLSRKIMMEYFANKKIEFFCKRIYFCSRSKDYNNVVNGYVKYIMTTNPAISPSYGEVSDWVTLLIGRTEYKAGLNDIITVYSNQTFESFISSRRFDL